MVENAPWKKLGEAIVVGVAVAGFGFYLMNASIAYLACGPTQLESKVVPADMIDVFWPPSWDLAYALVGAAASMALILVAASTMMEAFPKLIVARKWDDLLSFIMYLFNVVIVIAALYCVSEVARWSLQQPDILEICELKRSET